MKVTKTLKFILVVLFALSAQFWTANQGQARIKVEEKTSYFPVSGRTGAQLVQSLVKSVKRSRGRGFEISYNLKGVNTRVVRGRCKIITAIVVVKVRYALPRWRGEASASPSLRKAWRKVSDELLKGQKKHAALGVRFGRKFERTLKRTTGSVRNQCRDMGKKLAKRLERLGKQHTASQDRLAKRGKRSAGRFGDLLSALYLAR